MVDSNFNQVSVLVVDDSVVQRTKLNVYLKKKGFSVQLAEDGQAMKNLFRTHDFDIVLLDVNMPGDDGFTLTTYLREHHNVGIIMVTWSTDLVDRVLGLELGADDYITKPFEPRELIARIKSVLRRLNSVPELKAMSKTKHLVQFGRHVLDLNAQQLVDENGNDVKITSMEFDLLKAFAENRGQVLSRERLLTIAHNRESDPYDRSIDIRVTRIRRKIELDPSKPLVIKTIRGAGYIFVKE